MNVENVLKPPRKPIIIINTNSFEYSKEVVSVKIAENNPNKNDAKLLIITILRYFFTKNLPKNWKIRNLIYEPNTPPKETNNKELILSRGVNSNPSTLIEDLRRRLS